MKIHLKAMEHRLPY